MKYFTKLFLTSLSLLFFFISCRDDDNTINVPIDLLIGTYDNIPVIVNTEDSYTFTVSASNLNYKVDDDLTFGSDSLVITVTLTNVSSSMSFFTIYDINDFEIFSESLNNNKVVVNTELGVVNPKRIVAELSDFSGNLTIVLANKHQ